jgi:hypothetical protein
VAVTELNQIGALSYGQSVSDLFLVQEGTMKIALICDRYPPRPHTGIGALVQMLARGLNQRGHSVLVVEIGEVYRENSDQGVPVFTLPRSHLRWVGNLITRLRLRTWLATRAHSGAIDLIEVPDYPGFLPFAVPECATVVRLHQSSTVSHRLAGLKMSPGIRFYEKRTLAANPNWIGVSSHVLGLTQESFGVSPNRYAVIHNGIAPLRATGVAPPACLPASSSMPARSPEERAPWCWRRRRVNSCPAILMCTSSMPAAACPSLVSR